MNTKYMRLLTLIFIHYTVAFELFAQTAQFGWARQTGGSSNSEVACSITTDNSGSSIITGSFRESISFGAKTLISSGEGDIFIVKYDVSGNVLWAKKAGGTGNDRGWGITTDESGNIYVTGFCNDSATFGTITTTGAGMFVVKYDASGNALWAKVQGNNDYDLGYRIIADKTGSVFVTGEFRDTINFDTTTLTSFGSTDMFVAKYDASGNVLWAKYGGGPDADKGCGISVDDSGNIYLTGYFNGTGTFDSKIIHSSGSGDVFTLKYDTTGNIIWARKAGSIGNDQGSGIAIDRLGNIFVTGMFSETITFDNTSLISSGLDDIFLAKYNSLGDLIWVQKAGGNHFDRSWDVAVDKFGYSVITGGFYGSTYFNHIELVSYGDEDIVTALYDPSGNLLWVKQAGGMERDYARGIGVDNTGNSYMLGSFTGTAAFDNHALASQSYPAVFIAKITDDVGRYDSIAPRAPQDLRANPENNQIKLVWDSNVESDLSHYKIYRSINQGFTPIPDNLITTVAKPASSYTDNNVINDQTYYYRISAVDSSGNESDFSEEASAIAFKKTLIKVPVDFTTIQAAINAAMGGDTVLVQQGTYYENINFNGKAILVISESGPENTIIDGSRAGSVVTFNSGEDATTHFVGFTIKNGYGGNGGGISCDLTTSPFLENLVVENNEAEQHGGGIFCGGTNEIHSSPLIKNSIVRNNAANWGGGIYGDLSYFRLKNVVISKNSSTDYGGGVCCFGATSPEIINSTIVDNSASSFGGGICCPSGASPVVKNTIVSDNMGSHGIYATSGNPTISYSDFWNNENGNFYGCGENVGKNAIVNIHGDSCDMDFNIQMDPLFVDHTNGNYHLQQNSRCINAGDPLTPLDLDGTRSDIGAFYFHQGDLNAPDSPTNVQAIPGDSRITLSWNQNAELDLSHYNIYRHQNQGFTPTESNLLTTVLKPASDYIDLDVINDQTYYYRISAVDSSGNESEFSNEVSAKPFSNELSG
ncbi:MAG: hypothetical protein GF353_05665, partial [Candidatus Lokiarchaeota archaeon]|nr:hypothetical protein [Candidatus Lokiarchaeota archaeon]